MTGYPIFDDETLMRRVDGELSPERVAAVDAAAAGDADLAARLALLRRTRSGAAEAFSLTPDARDADLARLIAGGVATRPRPFRGWTDTLRQAFAPKYAVLWGGLATACFVVGLGIGVLSDRTSAGFVVDPDGAIADAGLIKVLDRRLASDGTDDQGRAIGLTFKDGQGRWCRTFQAGRAGIAGLACRQNDGWDMQVLAPFRAHGGEVRTASSETPAVVLAMVDAEMRGETLNASDEASARAGGWK